MSMKSWQQMCILIGNAVKQPVARAKPHVLSFFWKGGGEGTIGEAHGLIPLFIHSIKQQPLHMTVFLNSYCTVYMFEQ